MKRRRSFIRIRKWIPAFAGMTNKGKNGGHARYPHAFTTLQVV